MKLFYYIITFLSILLSSCEQRIGIPYEIIETQLSNSARCVASVRIKYILSEKELQELSKEIKASLNCKSDVIYISYLLPEMLKDNGAWAIVEFNPEYQISKIGTTLLLSSSVSSYANNVNDTKLVGIWIDDYEGSPVRIYKTDKYYYYEHFDINNDIKSEFALQIKLVATNGSSRFIRTERRNEYFTLDDSGNLMAYDEDGYVTTFRKIRTYFRDKFQP